MVLKLLRTCLLAALWLVRTPPARATEPANGHHAGHQGAVARHRTTIHLEAYPCGNAPTPAGEVTGTFKVHAKPVTDGALRLACDGFSDEARGRALVTLTDLMGTTVLRRKGLDAPLDVSRLVTGTYVLHTVVVDDAYCLKVVVVNR